MINIFLDLKNDNVDMVRWIKDMTQIFMNIAVGTATMFTAWWAYKTFYNKEKIQELKELKKAILDYHDSIMMYVSQVRENEMSKGEIEEMLNLGVQHNRLLNKYYTHLFTNPKTREKIQNLVGVWIANERLKNMPRRGSDWQKTEEERLKLFQRFDQEFKLVLSLIDKEAHKKI